ncbi:uncharacterized protein Tco025E_00683 [Trypanosoma conorhini]|uniref:Uncharacterized protein n=1 Tax=Trypanosoma conorhini TaxID=83891 RepID=A0A422QAT1_9TRYP|nr:uncharacterized protein Tco025E_00683 [Trypanosoma conorhini]RNF27046.1 hypothetical protein Tco025E_00683 [Trypanosoma conorhini]
MPKRSRSVLHAYLLPPSKRLHDEKRQSRHAPLAAQATFDLAPVAAAADNEVVPYDYGCGSSEAAFAASDAPSHVPRKFPEGWGGDIDEGALPDEPFIPEADRLVGLPPSCRAVQSEPNWLERALMLARGASRCTTRSQMPGGSELVFRLLPPAPTCLHLAGTTQEEKCRAAAVASIAAAFYAAACPEDPRVFSNACEASWAH